jgi:predicted ATPase/DNA-binding SARP family transcriptional activator
MQLLVLGTLEIVGAAPLRAPKPRRLLAALLVRANTVVSVDRLADVLWGDAPPERVEGSVHQVVSRLRVALRGSGIELLTSAPGYVLRVRRDELDATVFEDTLAGARVADPAARAALLDQALALWRGPAYAELADDDFARAEAARLEELRLLAREERAEAALLLDRPDEAVERLDELVAAHPLRERPHGQLMRALYRTGRQADALAAYRDHRARLRDELGLEPAPALRALHDAILRHDPSLGESPLSATVAGGATTAPAGNLPPAGAPRLIGRDDLLTQVTAAVGTRRLVTLTGPGGVGKSALALHAALTVGRAWSDGVWLCELAAVDDPGAVIQAVTTDLEVIPRQGLSQTDRLVEYLRPKRLLLVLDNCEHVVESAARLVNAVLRGCPHVVVLATSREPLGLTEEQVRPVPPLALPASVVTDADGTRRSAAVALFVERAEAAADGFALTDGNARAVAELCRRLDGLPLAIELAATRMRSMTPAEAVERLSGRFRFLRSGKRISAERHRTLQAVVDWSYQSLGDRERRAFARLSVFAGSFGLDAAEHVAATPEDPDPAEVADTVAALVDKSMVLTARDTGDATSRFTLLETLRAYGRERLAEHGTVDAAHRAHAAYHVDLVGRLPLSGPDVAGAADTITRCLDELRLAHGWSLGQDPDLAVRLIAALADYAELRMMPEVAYWAEQTAAAQHGQAQQDNPLLPVVYGVAAGGARFRGDLARAADLAHRGLAVASGPARRLPLYILGEVALFEGRMADCERVSAEAERLAEATGDDLRATLAGTNRVLARAYSGDIAGAVALAGSVRDRAERSGNPVAVAWARYAAGEARLETEPDVAVGLIEDALARAELLTERYLTGVALVSAASLRGRHGDPRRALPLFGEVMQRWHAAGDWTHQWTTVRNVIELLARIGADEPAAVLHGALASRTASAPTFGADAERLDRSRRLVAERVGAAAWAAAVDQGRRLSDDEVVRYARAAMLPLSR